ncbi:MAG: enoyl-CoA hydratase [Spirochaetaceae bacterium]|nr:enoyl-CoA hydratase [Spirochaetaceae bacterium]|tara:strand:- start:22200 stop:22964 length:765 start_codon:yes stop_codon:yes gene_type:complete
MINEKRNGHVLELEIATNELNTLDSEAFKALHSSLLKARSDDSVKTLILTGSGEKFFSNGFEPTMFIGKDFDEVCSLLQPAMDATSELLMFPRPVLSFINGHCMGVGSVLAIFTDYRIMIDGKARFGFPESQIGINFPSVPGFILKELVGIRNARSILFSGRPMKAPEALEMGVIDEAVSQEDARKRVEKYCNQFKDMALESVKGIKKSLTDYLRVPLEEMRKTDTEELARAVVSDNGQEGMRSIVERRRPVFK